MFEVSRHAWGYAIIQFNWFYKTQFAWTRGPMDKASAYGAGDCRFESCRVHLMLKPQCQISFRNKYIMEKHFIQNVVNRNDDML